VSALVWCGVAVLGGFGAVARVMVATFVSVRLPRAFPLGTFVVNISGAFLLGVLAGVEASDDAHRFAGLALLGSYTTFSTWMLEARLLRENGRGRVALAYVALSLVVGLGAVALGRWVGSLL
jgi:CrcB protein